MLYISLIHQAQFDLSLVLQEALLQVFFGESLS